MCAISNSKKVAISESREITQVAYLRQVMNIESCRMKKLEKERTQYGLDISVCDKLLEKNLPSQIRVKSHE